MSDEIVQRAEKARQICARPEGFKVCEGCESIVVVKAVTCPNCNGYRFDGSAERVIAVATVLGSRESVSLSPKDFE